MQEIDLTKLKLMPGKMLGKILSNLETSEGGIIMASTVKQTPMKALVIKVGPPKRGKKGKLVEPCAKVGDIAHFKKNFGVKWRPEKDSEEYIFLENDHITGLEVEE